MYKIDKLLKQDEKLFHTQDLRLIWGISNKNTLYTTIKRYIQKGILIPIHKGFYSTLPLEKVNPVRLGIGYLHRFSYLSGESVLVKEGVIFQKENYITLMSSVSKKFTLGKNSFLVRKMKDDFLYNDGGIEEKEGIKTASLERAVADLLYFNPNYYFDNSKKINWKKVKEIKKIVFGS
ncbi:MAG: type IV toxin-antitoxin system AbiEi family antitoxin domain-containing protein [Patescibacteria group bacterium]|nr:type IV toxin-antitoxin system AbiEi family antitoxin domain-containing protein [Patescibacteria group bacterium]